MSAWRSEKAEDEIGLRARKSLGDIRRGEGRHPGFSRRASGGRTAIAGNADDALPAAQQIERLDSLLGQADDPFGGEHCFTQRDSVRTTFILAARRDPVEVSGALASAQAAADRARGARAKYRRRRRRVVIKALIFGKNGSRAVRAHIRRLHRGGSTGDGERGRLYGPEADFDDGRASRRARRGRAVDSA